MEQELARRINAELKSMPVYEYSECFFKWMTLHQKCINLGGEHSKRVRALLSLLLFFILFIFTPLIHRQIKLSKDITSHLTSLGSQKEKTALILHIMLLLNSNLEFH